MDRNQTKIEVFEKIRSRYFNITMGNIDGKTVLNPKDATFFNFEFTDSKDSSTVTVAVLPYVIKVYHIADIVKNSNMEERKKWYSFLKELRKIAMKNMMRFDVHNIQRPKLDLNDIKAELELDPDIVFESKMFGSTKTSYQKIKGSKNQAKLIVRHALKVNEEVKGSRSRHIKSIFVENSDGERFKLPFNSLLGARAMARHITEGGTVYDTEGKAITVLIEEYAKLTPLLRSLKKRYPDGHSIIESIVNYRKHIKSTLGKLKGKRTYKKAIADIVDMAETISDDQLDDIKKRVKLTDSALLPVVYKSVKYSKKQPK